MNLATKIALSNLPILIPILFFLYFRLFNTANSEYKDLPMTANELFITSDGSPCATN